MADPTGGAAPLGGSPIPQPAASPRATAPMEVNDALKAMASATENQNQLTRELLKHFERVQRSVTDINKDLAYGHSEMRTILKDATNLEFSMKRIKQLKASRVATGSSQGGTLAYIRSLERESKILLQTLNAGRGQDKFTKEIKKNLEAYHKVLAKVESQGDRTWDDKQIHEVNAELKLAGQNVENLQKRMERIKVAKVTDGFKQLGRAIDDAFDNRFLSTMSRTPGLGGFMKVMGAKSRIDDARADIGTKMGERAKIRQESLRANALEVRAKFGSKGTQALRQMGYTGGLPGDPRHGTKRRHTLSRPAAGAGAQAAAGALEQMTVKTLTVQNMTGPGLSDGRPGRKKKNRGGRRGVDPIAAAVDSPAQVEVPRGRSLPGKRGLRQRAADVLRQRGTTPGPASGEVAEIMHGPSGVMGRATNRVLGRMAKGNGAMGRWAQGRIAAGAGSAASGVAEGALSMGGMAARGALNFASKAAVPVAIATALIQLRDKVAADNKEVHNALAGGGLYAGGQSANRAYQNTRNTLLSTGFTDAAQLGVDKKSNMALMGTLQEQGWGTGRTLSRAQGSRGSVNLGQALNDHSGLAGGGFYGAMMQNTVYAGRNMGMSQDTSSRLTLKLIEKFGQTTQSTKEFFLQLDDMMQSSGVSASKYVDVIDAVTDNFDTMNKSLHGTIGLLSTLGKTGRMTGDQMKEVIQQVTAPNQMSTAQRAFAIQSMTKEDIATAIRGENAAITADLDALNQQIAKFGIGTKMSAGFQEQGDVEEAIKKSSSSDEDKKAAYGAIAAAKARVIAALARAESLGRGDVVSAASAVDNTGDSSATAWTMRRARLQNLARMVEGGIDMNKLLGGDADEVSRFLQSAAVGQAQQAGTFGAGGSAAKELAAFDQIGRTSANSAVSLAQEKVDWDHARVEPGADASPEEKMEADRVNKRRGAMWDTMRDLQKARNPQAAAGMTDRQLVDKFQGDAAANPAALINELTQLKTTMDMGLTQGSPLQRASEAIKDKLAEIQADRDARDIADKTRTTADVFASAFEYLFDRLTNILTPIMNIMTFKWGGDAKDEMAKKEQDQEARNARSAWLKETLGGLSGGELKGDARKKWKSDKAALTKELRELNPSDPAYWAKEGPVQKRIRELAERSGEGIGKSTEAADRPNYDEVQAPKVSAAAEAARNLRIGWVRDAEQSDASYRALTNAPETYGGYLAEAVGTGSLAERRKGFTETFGRSQFKGAQAVWGDGGVVDGVQAEVGSPMAKALAAMAEQSGPGAFTSRENTHGNKTYITYYMTTTTPTVPPDAAAARRSPQANMATK